MFSTTPDLTKAVVDTSPLFNALMLTFVRENPSLRGVLLKKPVSDYLLNNPAYQRNFLDLFQSIRKVMFTSHVIAEIQRLAQQQDNYIREFWQNAFVFLREKKVDEQLIKILSLAEKPEAELVGEIGPTDTALIELARREKCCLLTDDRRTLGAKASVRGVKCVFPEEVLTYY